MMYIDLGKTGVWFDEKEAHFDKCQSVSQSQERKQTSI